MMAEQETKAGLGRREVWALGMAAVAVLSVRLLFPTWAPPVSGDEGTWPLGAKLLADEGQLVPNFFTTPLYHLVLALQFKVFGSTLSVARVSSAVFGVVNLLLTYRLALRLLGDRRSAIWAALLLGTSYPAVLVDRKAFIESMQITWMLGLTICYLEVGRRALIGIILCTAGLLLTKANAVFLIPALGVASLVEWNKGPSGDWRHLAGLAAGVAIAMLGYALVYLVNPAEFIGGWSQKLMVGSHQKLATDLTGSDIINAGPVQQVHRPLFAIGRFRFNPFAWDGKIRELTASEPFLAVGGALAVFKALWTRRMPALSMWLLFGMAFYFVQGHLENHVLVLFPVLAIGTAWILFEGAKDSWPIVAATAIFLFGLGRATGNLATSPERTAAGTRWLAAHASPTESVVAAPRILMIVKGKPISMFALDDENLPTCATIRKVSADWIFFDDKEWMEYIRVAKHTMKQVADSLAGCTTEAYRDRASRIYRVVPPAP